MLSVWGGDYILNSFLYSAHQHGLMEVAVTKEKAYVFSLNFIEFWKFFSKKYASYLATTCWLTCIGGLIPEIGETYPDKFVDIVLQTTDAPTVSFKWLIDWLINFYQAYIHPNGTRLSAHGSADFYIHPYNVSVPPLIRADIRFEGKLNMSMKRGKVGKFLQGSASRRRASVRNFIQNLRLSANLPSTHLQFALSNRQWAMSTPTLFFSFKKCSRPPLQTQSINSWRKVVDWLIDWLIDFQE